MTNPFGIAIDEFEDMDAVEVEEAPQAAPKPAAKKVAAKPVSKPVESVQEPVAAFREEAPKQVQMSEIDRLIEAKAKEVSSGYAMRLTPGDDFYAWFLADDPVTFYRHFVPTINRYIICLDTQDGTDPSKCPICAKYGKPAQFCGAYPVFVFDPQTKEKKVTVLELTLTNLATIIAEKKDCGGTLKDHKVNITVLRAATGKGVMLRTRSKGVMPLGMPVKLPPINKAPLSNQAVLALLGEQSTPEEFVSEGENNPFGD